MSIQAIAFDLDDTLLRSDGSVSDYTVEILHRAADRGIHIIPASGRTRDSMWHAVSRVGCASCFISLGPLLRFILSVRSSASLIELAVATIFSIGLNVLEDIQRAPRNVMMRIIGNIITVSRSITFVMPTWLSVITTPLIHSPVTSMSTYLS